MHEASLVEGMLGLAVHAAEEFHAANPGSPKPKIKEIICEAGLLACFEPDALRACFEVLSEGTIAEGAELVVKTAPLACACGACGHRFKLFRRHFVCPRCQSDDVNFSGGSGLVIQAINVESGEDAHD